MPSKFDFGWVSGLYSFPPVSQFRKGGQVVPTVGLKLHASSSSWAKIRLHTERPGLPGSAWKFVWVGWDGVGQLINLSLPN